MPMHLKAAATGLLVAFAGSAFAQDVVIVPEQETVIREYVVNHPVNPVVVDQGVDISVGTALPEAIELYPIDEPQIQYRYVVVDGRTVLVDPGTRRIVRIIE